MGCGRCLPVGHTLVALLCIAEDRAVRRDLSHVPSP